jgi:phage tail-like protein
VSPVAEDGKTVGLSHKFVVRVGQDLDLGHWTKAEGLEVSFEVAEYRSGDLWNRRMIAPALPKYGNIKLSRVATQGGAETVRKWLKIASNGMATGTTPQPLSYIVVQLRDGHNQPVHTWGLRDPVPVKWRIGAFDAKTSGVAVEELEFAYDGFLDDDREIKMGVPSYGPWNVGMQMRFLVEMDGIDLGGWTKCSGLGVDFHPLKREEGGTNNTVYWLADRMVYDTLKLTRVVNSVDSPKVYSWLQARMSNFRGSKAADMMPTIVPGTTGKIDLLGAMGQKVMTWSLRNVTPKKWTGPELSGAGKDVALETLELNHEGFL